MTQDKQDLTFTKAIELFIKDLQDKSKSNLTIKNYTVDLNKFVEWLNERDPHPRGATPTEIGRVAIKDYAQFLRTSGSVAPATANRRIVSLKSFFGFLSDNGYIETNPTTDVKTKAIQRQNEVKWLTRSEVSKLFHAIDTARVNQTMKTRNKTILTVLLNCGLRVSELADLKLADVDLDNKVITVFNGKGEKFRRVPLGKATAKTVTEWLKARDTNSEYLFTSQKGGKLSERGVQHLFKDLAEATGVEVTPHSCRHTFCKQIADKTSKLEAVADLAGHTSVETSRRYVTPSMKELKKAVEDVEFEG